MQDLLNRILDELRGAWRFRWVAVAGAWTVSVIGWAVVYALPDQYEASARIYVDTRTALRPLLQGVAADQDVEAQLVMVRQALLGRPNLERVAREADLLIRATTPEARQNRINSVASRIMIELEPPTSRDERVPNTFYRISYRDLNRDKAIKVVDVLLNAFVEDTLGAKRGGAESAQRFLQDQLKQYRERLVQAEEALAEFKKKNVGMIPGEGGGYFQRLQAEQDAVQRAEAALRVALNRRAELGRQMTGEDPFVTAPGVAGSARGTASQSLAPADTATRIQEAQARLDDLLLRFTEKHPDVLAARETLTQLRVRQQAELEALRRGDAGAAAIAGASANPVYQSIQLAANQVDVEIASLRGTVNDHRRNVAEMRRALDTAPEVEAEFARLTRDYDVTRAQYTALLQRLEQARVSEDAQATGVVDFDIIDPPTAGFGPVFPNRPLLLLGVFLFASAAGIGLAWLLDKLKPVFHHSRPLAEMTGLPVIGVVSLAWLEKHKAQLHREYMRLAISAGLLLITSAAMLLVHEYGARLARKILG